METILTAKLQADVRKDDWGTVFNCSNRNDCLSRFLHKFNKISTMHAPLKELKITNNSCKPWITSELKNPLKRVISFANQSATVITRGYQSYRDCLKLAG